MSKEEILENIKNVQSTNAMNLMGCNESWYNAYYAYYAIKKTFSMDEIEQMSEKELNDLVRLAEALGDAFY